LCAGDASTTPAVGVVTRISPQHCRLHHNIFQGDGPSDAVGCLIRGLGVVVLVVLVVVVAVTDLETASSATSTGFVLVLPGKVAGCFCL